MLVPGLVYPFSPSGAPINRRGSRGISAQGGSKGGNCHGRVRRSFHVKLHGGSASHAMYSCGIAWFGNETALIRWAGIRIVAAHRGVVAVRVLRAIPGGVVAWVTVTQTVTEVVAKKNAADAEYGAAPESTKLSVEARIEVPTCEGVPNAEATACERVPSAEVATMPAAFVSACGHGGLCHPDGERGGSGEIP